MIVSIAACAPDEPSRGVTVTDSAGVRVVVNHGVQRRYAQVEAIPLLSIGGPDAEGPELFSNVRGIHVDPAGRVWVVDGGSAEIRIFRADGSHWRTLGRRGEGPGEFVRPRLLGGFGRDSVAVWDDAAARLTVFDADGEIARLETPTAVVQAGIQPIGILENGLVLGRERTILAAAGLEPGQLLTDSAGFVLVDLESGRADRLGTVDGPRWIWTGRMQVPMPFTINPAIGLHGQALHVAVGTTFRVGVFRDGQRAELYGVDRGRREVTGQDIAAYRMMHEDALPESDQRRQYLAALDHAERPRHLPGYVHLRITPAGETWARVYEANLMSRAVWDVYAPSREWLGQVETPAGFDVAAVGGDLLTGIWRDELAVEQVRAYRVVRAS